MRYTHQYSKRKKNKIKTIDWQMTKNYSHYKFEQKIF